MLLIPAIPVLAEDSDWQAPSSVDISENISNPESAYLSDNNYAVALGENASVTYANFGFNIPEGAKIHGIEVRVEVRACSPVCNSSVTLSLSSNSGANFTSGYSITDIDFVDSFIILGGTTDTWGNTWAHDSFSNANFKVRLEANAGVDAVFIDVLQIKIYYTPIVTQPSFTINASAAGGIEGSKGGRVVTGGPEVNRNPCPLTLTVDMMGEIQTATMTLSGVLCQEYLATSPGKEHQFYLEEGTIISSPDGVVPIYIRVDEVTDTLPKPADGVIVSSVFMVNAFLDEQSEDPVPIMLEPAAVLSLGYSQNNLPENASVIHISYYDISGTWNQISGIAGPAEIGKARGEVNHFTHFAVIARTEPGGDSDCVLSHLTITPDRIKGNEEVTISANISSNGSTVSEYIARLLVNGKVVESQIHNLSPGESKQINFVITGDIPGINQVTIGDLSGQFEVIVEKAPGIKWYIWVVIGVAVFCIWRFRRTWIKVLYLVFNR